MLALAVAVPLATTLLQPGHVQQAPPFTVTATGYGNATSPAQWRGAIPAAPEYAARLEDLRGRIVVLDLMAVTCLPCRDVARETLRPLAAAAPPNLTILSIDTWSDPAASPFGGEDRAALLRLQQEEDLTWPHARDTGGVWRSYQAVSLPRLLVVDADGAIVADHQGVVSSAELAKDLERASRTRQAQGASPAETGGGAAGFATYSLPALALLAGGAAVVSPCSIGLLPAYLALLAPRTSRGSGKALLGGAAVAAAILLVDLGLALLMWGFGAAVGPWVPHLALLAGAGLAALGTWTFLGGTGAGLGRLASRLDGRRGPFVFGVGFALAGFGCSGPILAPLLFAGFARGPAWGFLMFLMYGGALALVVMALAGAVALGASPFRPAMRRHAALATRVVGLAMALAGLLVIWQSLPLRFGA